MPDTLLRTKLFVPPLRPNLVPRPRLIERLNHGLQLGRKLTLISAPAGFGKTTLLSMWLDSLGSRATSKDQSALRFAWLSLDESDSDLTRFLTYCLSAVYELEGTEVALGQGALSMLQVPQPPPTEVVLTYLINDIAAVAGRILLVLDDYHLVDSSSIDDALTFMLDHLPRQLHLVIATREDPKLPLARYRARDEITELRVAELRFTPGEVADFLNQLMGLSLTNEEIASLETRTEGWVAGLQLAALSMRGRENISTFIDAFAGDNRYIMDYLVQEVLQRQPDNVRNFLLQTSILDRLSGPLCDAVTGLENGRWMLEDLERGNLFVIPLDDRRHWYRYHHLFAEVLRAHAMARQPDRIPILHGRASHWYEENGSLSEAIHHALAAEDFERVASLAELAWQAMDDSFQSNAWLGWVKNLPDELIRAKPRLSTQYACALWMVGELEASESRLRDAERCLQPIGDMSARPEGSTDGIVVVDDERYRTLPAIIARVRSNIAQAKGDVSGSVKYAELALKLLPEEDHTGRAQATVSLGFAHWMSGDLEAAHRALAEWINSMQKAGNTIFAIASTYALADILVAQGRLQEAVGAYQHALRLASEHDKHVQRIIAHVYLGLAMLYHEKGDQEAAAQQLLKSKELGEFSTLPDWPSRWSLAQAQLKESAGDLEAALELLDKAKRLYVRNVIPDIRPIEALKARVYVKQGRLSKALDWVDEQGLSVDDELSYIREFEHITLTRVLIAEYKSDRAEHAILRATGLLERLLKAAEAGKRIGSVIDILVLQALAHQAQGNMPLALASLERAMTLAEPAGYVRIFVDEGAPMAALLERLKTEDEIIQEYVRKLLAAFVEKEFYPLALDPQSLVDPLSKRELEVLELLTTELTGPEIAKELVVSMNTIRTHTKNIYSKLGVNSRRDAVRRAKDLSLL